MRQHIKIFLLAHLVSLFCHAGFEFADAVSMNDIAKVKELLSAADFDVNSYYSRNRIPVLLEAVQRGNTDVAIALINAGASPNGRAGGGTALMWAVLNIDESTVRNLLAAGANPLLTGEANPEHRYLYSQRALTLTHSTQVLERLARNFALDNNNPEHYQRHTRIIEMLQAAERTWVPPPPPNATAAPAATTGLTNSLPPDFATASSVK